MSDRITREELRIARVDKLIGEEEYFEALEVLHPTLSEHISAHCRKQQRQIDTFKLKSVEPDAVDQSEEE